MSDSLVKTNYSKGLITLFVMITTIMQVMDMTIANVALPYMKGSISATQDQISWVLTSYIIAAAIMTQPVSWFVERFGRRKVFLISVIGFTFASMLCGMASSIEEIVMFRILQGIFGAALVPLSQSTLLDSAWMKTLFFRNSRFFITQKFSKKIQNLTNLKFLSKLSEKFEFRAAEILSLLLKVSIIRYY